MLKARKLQGRVTLKMVAAFLLSASLVLSVFQHDASAARYIFPVLGHSGYENGFTSPRANGPHHAIDIMAGKHQKIVSASDGTIIFVGSPQPSWGYAVFVRSDSGYTYHYLHLNNDTPGTDNGRGGEMNAYAPDMEVGNRIVRGQLIGYVGDSGNAETTPPHLHFEVTDRNDKPYNPYQSLRSAQRISKPVGYPVLAGETLPYGADFKQEVNVAMGNFDGDAASEVVTGAGVGGGPRVRLYDDNRTTWLGYNFYAFSSGSRGGVDVAAGDVDGDNIDEIITASGPNTSNPGVAVYKLNGSGQVTKLNSFTAYSGFTKGINVATGDVDNDGEDEIITGAGIGGGPHVKVFESDGELLQNFFAYDEAFRGGVDVASANVLNSAPGAEIITMPQSIGSARIQVFSLDETRHANFYAYSGEYRGGGRVSAGNVAGVPGSQAEIITVTRGNVPRLLLHDGQGNRYGQSYFVETWWRGNYDVAAGEGEAIGAAGGNRRATVRASGF